MNKEESSFSFTDLDENVLQNLIDKDLDKDLGSYSLK
jgi:hypothetical protein